MNRRIFVALVLSILAAACGSQDEPAQRLRLATTTSTRDSGLLGHLLGPWSEDTGIEVQVIAVGTGQAIEIAKRGDADLVIVHARELEDAFVASGDGVDRRDLMWNDFVLAGPAADPAGVRGMTDVGAALRKIAEAKAPFVSRGDKSGTHVKEQELWKAAGGRPAWDGYREAGAGMGPTLQSADELEAYVLTDRGTLLSYRGKLDIEVVVEGDPALRNPYGVILVNPARHPHVNAGGARRLSDHLTSPEGQRRIGEFRVDGEQLFHPHGGAN
jgi:tungstate transport system substrate-binding protein